MTQRTYNGNTLCKVMTVAQKSSGEVTVHCESPWIYRGGRRKTLPVTLGIKPQLAEAVSA